MASTLTPFQAPVIGASSASSSSRRPDASRRKAVSSNWWAPLFGWSSEPDYLGNTSGPTQNLSAMPDSAPEAERPRSKFALGCFTEEKAKQLRRKTLEGSTFHDVMYHSAIASRLAVDLPNRLEK